MNIAMSPTREKYPLSRRKIIKKTVARTLVLAVIIMLGWLGSTISLAVTVENNMGLAIGGITAAAIVVLLLLIGSVYLYQKWYFSTYFYDLTNDYIVIKKGPITPTEITIPYERVQDVYVDQDLLDRIFGIYDVHLSSATASSGMEAHIDGVEKAAADGLRALLLQTVQERISKHRSAAPSPAPMSVPPTPPLN